MTTNDNFTPGKLQIHRTTLWASDPLDIPAVRARFSAGDEPKPESWSQVYKGLFDTGTCTTMISTRIVNQLNLKSTDSEEVSTAFGSDDAFIYYINVIIQPMQLIISNIKAHAASLDSGVEFLIGSDILSLGDFSISTHHGFKVVDFAIYELLR